MSWQIFFSLSFPFIIFLFPVKIYYKWNFCCRWNPLKMNFWIRVYLARLLVVDIFLKRIVIKKLIIWLPNARERETICPCTFTIIWKLLFFPLFFSISFLIIYSQNIIHCPYTLNVFLFFNRTSLKKNSLFQHSFSYINCRQIGAKLTTWKQA